MKKILLASAHHWTSPFRVGGHHIAKAFTNMGYKVGHISAPISPLHLLGGMTKILYDRWLLYVNGGVEVEKDIWAYVPGALLTPNIHVILKTYWLHRNWYRLSFPSLVGKIKQKGFDSIDILYLDNSIHYCLLDLIDYKKCIFRIADYNKGFSNITKANIDTEKEIARRADVVLYSAKNLENYINTLSPRQMLFFPNGVDYPHFANSAGNKPPELKNIKKPIALYVGAMDEWFDFKLINYLAAKHPNIAFVLIGPTNLAKDRLKESSNIHLLGTRKYRDIPNYMHNADVGLIPFDVKNNPDLLNSVNPLKLYEYMACGLPVVSSKWQELLLLNSPAILCTTPDEFSKAILTACAEGKKNKNVYQNYARQFDWGKKIEMLI